jgi:uncharacterized protein (TIGR03435 family)
MFDRLCTLLLRLYPAEFRRLYGRESLQLIKDRIAHERGPALRARLLFDLVSDLFTTSVSWQPPAPQLARVDGMPRFVFIEGRRPRPQAMAAGTFLSMAMLATFTLLFQPRVFPPAPAQLGEGSGDSSAALAAESGPQPTAPGTGGGSASCEVGGDPPLAFETISILPSRADQRGMMRMRVLPNGDVSARSVPVLWLVGYAYDLPFNPSPRLQGLPESFDTYDIEAKAPAGAMQPADSESERHRRSQAMVRALLADRFKLVMRGDRQWTSVYALAVARRGANVARSTMVERDCVFDTGATAGCHTFVNGRGHPLNGAAVTMEDVARYIENWTDHPVVDRTGMSGLFTVSSDGWRPLRLPPPPPGNPPGMTFDDLPTIFTVLETLGLELRPQEAVVPFCTVEHIERPTQ